MPILPPEVNQTGIPAAAGSMNAEDRDTELHAAIAEYLEGEGDFGLDPRALAILDDMDASKREIISVEEMIDVVIAIRLRSMADSVYHGNMRQGKAGNFAEVITSLGMRRSRVFIIAMALFSRMGAEHMHLQIESFATSLLARLIAEQMGFDQSSMEKAELGGLFLNLGKVVIAAYQFKAKAEIEPAFVEKYHRYFAAEIITRFNLPEYLGDYIQEERLVLLKKSFSVGGIVYLARSLVEKIIRECGIIEVKSPMPEVKDNLDVSLGSIISEHFGMIGLGKYVKVIPG